MEQLNYNDENLFSASESNLKEKLNGFVQIPITYKQYGDLSVEIDTETMLEEFQRTVSGIQIVIDFIQDKPFDDMI